MSLTLTRRHNVDRFGYLIPHRYGNLPVLGAVATFRPGEGKFGRGAVAVEEGTENKIAAPTMFAGWARLDGGAVLDNDGSFYPLQAKFARVTTTSWGFQSNSIPATNGQTWSISFIARRGTGDGGPGADIMRMNESNKHVSNITPTFSSRNIGGGWVRYEATFTINYADTGYIRLRFYVTATNGGYHDFALPQLEQKPFATSFVDGIRPDGILAYPVALPDDYTIACYRKSHTDEDYKHVVKLSDGTVYVDGVEDSEYDVGWIGGRNLLKNSDFSNGLTGWFTSSSGIVNIVDDNDFYKVCKVEASGRTQGIYGRPTTGVLTAEETYTLSAMVKADGEMSIGVAIDGSGLSSGMTKTIGTSWEKVVFTKVSSGNNTNPRVYSNSAGTFYIAWIKVEKGNKATDWTPAPEDLGYSDDRLMFSNQTGLIDELLILPYAASDEEIRAWYEADGPLPPHPDALLQWDRQAVTRRHNVDRFGYLIPTWYGNVPMVGAVATFRPGEGKFGRGAVAVEEGTENLANTDMEMWNENVAVIEKLNETLNGNPVWRLTFNAASNQRIFYHFAYTDGQTFTSSIYVRYVRGVNATGSHPQLYFREAGFGNQYGYVSVPRTTQWSRVSLTRTLLGAGTCMFLFYKPVADTSEDIVIDISMPQLEQKSFATSFTEGTRPDGILAYPIALPENHTITCYRKSHTDEGYRHVVKRSDGKVFVNGVEDSEYDIGWIAGRNLIQKSWLKNNSDIDFRTGLEQSSEKSRTIVTEFIQVTPQQTYMFQRPVNRGNVGARYYDSDKNHIGSENLGSRRVYEVSIPDGCYYFKFIDEANTLDEGYKFEKGNKATDWTPAPEDLGYDGDMLMLSNQTGLVDELLILPYAASEEEIASWYEAKGPIPPHPQALLQWDWQAVRPAQIVKL